MTGVPRSLPKRQRPDLMIIVSQGRPMALVRWPATSLPSIASASEPTGPRHAGSLSMRSDIGCAAGDLMVFLGKRAAVCRPKSANVG